MCVFPLNIPLERVKKATRTSQETESTGSLDFAAEAVSSDCLMDAAPPQIPGLWGFMTISPSKSSDRPDPRPASSVSSGRRLVGRDAQVLWPGPESQLPRGYVSRRTDAHRVGRDEGGMKTVPC